MLLAKKLTTTQRQTEDIVLAPIPYVRAYEECDVAHTVGCLNHCSDVAHALNFPKLVQDYATCSI